MIAENEVIDLVRDFYTGYKDAESATAERYVDIITGRATIRYVQVFVKNHGREYRALYDPDFDMEVAQQMDTETLAQFLNRVIFEVGQMDGETAKLRVVDEDGEYIINGGF